MLPSAAVYNKDSSASTAQRVAQLQQRWPCREQLIDQLVNHITFSGSSGAPLFIFGPPATGKTAIVRDIFRELGVRHAYVNCQEVSKTKPLLSSILHQLKGAKRRREEGYDCSAKCDSITEFLLALPGVAGSMRPGRGGSSMPCCSWVVVDNAQRLAGSEVLTALMKMRDSCGAAVGLALISAVPWYSGRYLRDTAPVAEPQHVRAPSYTHTELQKILEHRRQRELGRVPADAVGFHQFLAQFVPIFCRASNNLTDLQAAVAQLYPRYVRHQQRLLKEGRQPQAQTLFALVSEDVRRVISELDVHGRGLAGRQAKRDEREDPTAAAAEAAPSAAASPAVEPPSSRSLGFELPFVSKFLLLAAYIASRNKPSTDRQVFDPGHKGTRGRGGGQAADRAAEAALEARLRGPHTFPLERLLHIFYCLYPHHEGEDDESEERGLGRGRPGAAAGAQQRSNREPWQEMQQGEVLMQLATLVSLRLLSQSSGDPLEGGMYRCNLSEEMAGKVARNLDVRLADYLKLG